MIVRSWRGWAKLERAEDYVAHFRHTVMPGLTRLAGFLGASLLQESRAGEVEFLVLTRWASLAAVKGFAGADYANAVVEPEAAAALARYERTVQHYDVVEDISRKP